MKSGEGSANHASNQRKSALLVVLAVFLLALPAPAFAKPAPLSKEAKKGLKLAKDGDCVAAVPELEKAEADRHRPQTAVALASCHVSLGELMLAHEILVALAAESASAEWSKDDGKAHAKAKEDAKEIDARIPTITFRVEPDVAFTVTIGAKEWEGGEFIRVPPDERVDATVRAKGFADVVESVVATEGESREVVVSLAPLKKPPATPPPAPENEHWLGVGARGIVMPQFLVGAFGEGGQTLFFPGGEVRYARRLGSVDVEPSLSIMSFGAGTFPFKPHDVPDTEWELIESDLLGMTVALDVLYRVALTDSGSVEFRVGAGFGFGWAFYGEIYRWQSYPSDLQPGDPSTYKKCKGPNNPAGSYTYCNQLDKDAERYGQPDPWWGDGGSRPIIYPWLSLPQTGFAFRPSEGLFIDVEVGVTPVGLLTHLGTRFAL